MLSKPDYSPRLKQMYLDTIKPALCRELELKNAMMTPQLEKIVLNMGIGEAVRDTKKVKSAQHDLTLIAGQKAVITRAKKSIAAFRVREGMPLGVKVTLRANKMYEFFDRLITVCLPRTRDFRGFSTKSFDAQGNFALGVHEHITFPEIDYDKVDAIWGLDVVICTTTNRPDHAKALLKHFNVPFRD